MRKITKILLISVILVVFLTSCQSKKEKGNLEKESTTKSQESMEEPAEKIEVSDKEVEKFITIANQLRTSQNESRMTSMNKVKESDLGMRKYQEIAQSQNNPQSNAGQNFTEEELQQFAELNEELMEIQTEAQKEAEEIIEAEGMDFERYKAISLAVRQDSTLGKRLQEEAMKQRQKK